MLLEGDVGAGFPAEATSYAVNVAKKTFPTFGFKCPLMVPFCPDTKIR